MAKTREEVAALNANTKFRIIGRDGIVLHTVGSTVDQRVDWGKTFKVWYLVEHIGDPVPIMVDGDEHKYWLNAEVFAELWSKGKIEFVKDGKVESQDDLKPGTFLEVKDHNTGTWVYGMLLNVYDSELHNGIIVNLLRADGTTVDIDCVYADVYFAPNYNIEHFCRTLQRYLYETQEKAKLLTRGIALCQHTTDKLDAKAIELPEASVDAHMWFYMGWQPKISTDKPKPLYLIGRRLLLETGDTWIFLANGRSLFQFVMIPVKQGLTVSSFEAACNKAGCKISDIVNSSEFEYIDSVLGRWSKEITRSFSNQLELGTGYQFELIKIIPTEMPVPQ